MEEERVKISKTESIVLDEWQREVLDRNGNLCIRAGRQVGKSTIIALKAALAAIENKDYSIMIISATERQAYLLFLKVLNYLLDNHKSYVKQGMRDRPTKSEIKLNNGSVIRCLPTGITGLGIRGYTINLLIADEAAFIPSEVWPAITPALSTTGGSIILISTPFGKEGYFYDCFNNDSFTKWHINAEDVADTREEPQKSYIKEFHNEEQDRMTALQYAQEYLGEFVDELRQLFPNELIKKICTLKRIPNMSPEHRELYLGCDIARMGDDYSTFEIVEKISKDNLAHRESISTGKKYTTQTYDKILDLDNRYKFKKIGIDAGAGSLGVGIFDFLMRSHVKRKVLALNNAQRNLDHLGEKKKTLQKEDMYLNLLAMMEKGKIKLLSDDELINSLRGIQYEYNMNKNSKSSMKIFASVHKYTDLVEGLIRAVWLANQKHIKSFISSM